MDNTPGVQGRKLVVIGGGAAGFFCAVNAARMAPGLSVTIFEKSGKVLSKVRVSGGGRCNVTHACFDRTDMAARYPRGSNFVKKAFHQFFTSDTISWFSERGVKLKEEPDGRMFPVSNTSQTIVDCLQEEVRRYNVQVQLQTEVKELALAPTAVHQGENGGERRRFMLVIQVAGEIRSLEADFVCVACGGYPKAAMFSWLSATGHRIEPPVPSLFTFNMPGNPITRLMGVSVNPVTVKIRGTRLESEGPILITHWGMSGPAILKLSAWGARELAARNYEFSVQVNWLPGYHEQSMRVLLDQYRAERPGQMLHGKNFAGLPQRLWNYLLEQAGVAETTRWGDLAAGSRNQLVKLICVYEAAVSGKTTFKEEFVTAGGVWPAEVEAHTMRSKKLPGLYFAGEILDVDGVTGGFNFQHAWTSAWIAAKSISEASA